MNAHLLSGEASYRSAGIHGRIYNLLKHLPGAAPEYRYTVFVGAGQPPTDPAVQVRRSRFPTQNPLGRILWEQFVAPIEQIRLRANLLHGMAFALPLAWAGPAVVTIHDLSFIRYPERLSASRRAYLTQITGISARIAQRVIVVSESTKSEVVELLGIPAEKIDVVLPGVGEQFQPLPPEQIARFRQQYGLPDRFILHVGTLEPRKNLEVLLNAYVQLPQRSEVKLVLAGGKGWQTGPIFALIDQLSLTQDVVLPGYVPNEALPLWYNASAVFVYPSVYEGFGLPILEAMACGVPVIAADTTSLPEAVGPGGILLPPDDAAAWRETLSTLLADEQMRAEQVDRGKQWARNFSWMRSAHQTIEVYRRMLNDVG